MKDIEDNKLKSNVRKIMSINRFSVYGLWTMVLSLFLVGCATTEYRPLPLPPTPSTNIKKEEVVVEKKEEKKPQGIYHKVIKGQTLWRISKMYDVTVDDIIDANKIPNVAAIEVGQLILIPGAQEKKEGEEIHAEDQNKDEFAWPIKGRVISYYRDQRGEGVNKGIDIAATPGDPVKASRAGKVILADNMSGYFQTVMIDHEDGYISVYTNNRKLLVKLGDSVFKGDAIAEVGTLGTKSFLHFEIRKGKDAVNPLYYLP